MLFRIPSCRVQPTELRSAGVKKEKKKEREEEKIG